MSLLEKYSLIPFKLAKLITQNNAKYGKLKKMAQE
jgi:hypothetical protein